MKRITYIIPGSPETLTGGHRYNRRIVEECRRAGWSVDYRSVGDDVPFPTDEDLAHNERQRQTELVFDELREGSVVVVDGLVFGLTPELMMRAASRLRLVALVHHPLADELGLDPALRDTLFHSERKSLAHAELVICTSHATKRRLRDFGVEDSRCWVIEPGTEPRECAVGSQGDTVNILSVASYTARKDHHTLFDAFAYMRQHENIDDRRLRLTCVGGGGFDVELEAQLEERARVEFNGNVKLLMNIPDADLDRLYRKSDIFVSSSRYEGYGMAIAEAVAYGLPIVAADSCMGAVAQTLPVDAGLRVPAGDPTALGDAIGRLVTDDSLRQQLKVAALTARSALPDWATASGRFRETLGRLL